MPEAKKTEKSAKNEPGKKEKAEQTRKQRKEAYNALKRQVLDFENSNFRYIVLIRQEGSHFWQACGHSAVFLSARISKRLKRPFNLREDTDFGVKSSGKVVYINSMGALKEGLKSLHIYPEVEKENSVRFRLDEAITHEDYQDMLGEEDRQKERANKVFVPEHLIPVLDEEIKKMNRHVRILTSGMKSPERDAYGTDMRKVAVEMTRLSTRLANSRIELEEFLRREKDLLFELDEFTNVIMSDGPYDVVRMAKFAEQYLRVQAEIERETRKMVAAKVEESFKGKSRRTGGSNEISKKEN